MLLARWKVLISNIKQKDWSKISNRIKNGYWSPLLAKIYRYYFDLFYENNGVRVVDEEWDYLIILDACRYDIFKEIYNDYLEGDLEKKISRGTSSNHWLKENFDSFYEELVYISNNSFVSPTEHGGFNSKEHFSKIYPLYLEDQPRENGMLKPEYVAKKSLDIINQHPDKRVIIHFMQPHTAYIGDYKLLDKNAGIEELSKDFSSKELKRAYKSNLERVLGSVKDLIDELEGNIVVTADHGEAFGEKGIYAHPHNVFIQELIEVPWLKINKEYNSLQGVDF